MYKGASKSKFTIEKKKIEDLYLGTKEIEKEYDKVKIKVTFYALPAFVEMERCAMQGNISV